MSISFVIWLSWALLTLSLLIGLSIVNRIIKESISRKMTILVRIADKLVGSACSKIFYSITNESFRFQKLITEIRRHRHSHSNNM